MINIKFKSICCGRSFHGTSISGVDIGPNSKISIYSKSKDKRVILHVKGYKFNLGMFSVPSYAHPRYYLIEKGMVKCEISYDRTDSRNAKSVILAFIEKGEVSTEFQQQVKLFK